MSIFAIGDLHLSLSGSKPMDIFPGWEGYMEKLETAWRGSVAAEDTVVVAGDISWAMSLEDTLEDFRFLDSLPGNKLLIKGNHDYWWSTRAKLESYFSAEGLRSLGILHNNAVEAEGVWLCGSRGWLFENGQPHDKKIVTREAGRIAASLAAAPADGEKLLFLHYPPVFAGQQTPEFMEIMVNYGVTRCFYGHLHGPALAGAFAGVCRGIQLTPISADHLDFCPLKIL